MSKPLPPLDAAMPACFRSLAQWLAYKKPADWLLQHGRASQEYSYCTDCTPSYQAEMQNAGRCAHPGTIFVLINQIIVGRRPV